MWVLSPFYIIDSKDLVTQLTRDHSLFKQLSKLICRGATKHISSMCGLTILLHMSKKFLRYVFFYYFRITRTSTSLRRRRRIRTNGCTWKYNHEQQRVDVIVVINCNSNSNFNLYNLDIFFLLFLFIQPKKKEANSFLISQPKFMT